MQATSIKPFVLLLLILFVSLSACSNSQHVKVTLPAKSTDIQLVNRLNDQALLKLKNEQPQQASEYLKQAIAANPQSSRSHNNLGKVYYQLKQYSDALNMFRKAIELDTNNSPQPHNNIAMVYERADKHALAIEHYTLAHDIEPDNIIYTANLARAMHHRGDRDAKLIAMLEEITLKDARPDWQHWASTQKAMLLADGIGE
tara:strand:- start:43977 stop:44579 length:603 start_codon:yes stop_codon:yes gene_type:complete